MTGPPADPPAGIYDVERAMQIGALPSSEPVSAEAKELRRDIIASLIAVKGHLDQPYPDDPRWTPWTRFIERTLDRVDELAALASARGETAAGHVSRLTTREDV